MAVSWLGGCRAQPPPPQPDVLTWQVVKTWSGRGNAQTESFGGDTGSFRIRWKTTGESPPGQGVFRLTLHSSISGRPLVQVADEKGAGGGIREVNEDPRIFHMVVESAAVDWTITVEEGTLGKVSPKPAR